MSADSVRAVYPISQPGLRAIILNRLLRYYSKRPAEKAPAGMVIKDRHLARGAKQMAKTLKRNERLPGNIRATRVAIPTPAGDLDAEWLETVNAKPDPDHVILYCHGGGYFMCSAASHRPLTSRLAKGAGRRVLSINYRQAPDHHYPAWLEDAVMAYRFLLDEGYAPEKIALGGDSAGGNLVLVALQQLRNEKLPMPGAAFCLSPWADMGCESPSLESNDARDVMFAGKGVKALARYHLADHDAKDPLLSPVHANFSDFPPLLIQVGSTEILRDDSRRVAAGARAAGVEVRLEEWHNMPHVFHLFAQFVPESRQAIRHLTAFVQKHA